jgi:hypothetical protein
MSLKKEEGAVFSPLPVAPAPPGPQRAPSRVYLSPDPRDPRCEMCGHAVIATHCKRICLHCGFMTGCSEGI